MKNVLRKCISITKNILEKAETKLDENPHPQPLLPSPGPVHLTQKIEDEDEDTELSTFEDRREMNDQLRAWARATKYTYKELKAEVRRHACVYTIDKMTKGQVKEACRWIAQQIESAKTLERPQNKRPRQRQGTLFEKQGKQS